MIYILLQCVSQGDGSVCSTCSTALECAEPSRLGSNSLRCKLQSHQADQSHGISGEPAPPHTSSHCAGFQKISTCNNLPPSYHRTSSWSWYYDYICHFVLRMRRGLCIRCEFWLHFVMPLCLTRVCMVCACVFI